VANVCFYHACMCATCRAAGTRWLDKASSPAGESALDTQPCRTSGEGKKSGREAVKSLTAVGGWEPGVASQQDALVSLREWAAQHWSSAGQGCRVMGVLFGTTVPMLPDKFCCPSTEQPMKFISLTPQGQESSEGSFQTELGHPSPWGI